MPSLEEWIETIIDLRFSGFDTTDISLMYDQEEEFIDSIDGYVKNHR